MIIETLIPLLSDLLRGTGVRMPKNVRKLSPYEIKIAKSVFEDTVNYNWILLSDGAGMDGREFTLPIPGVPPLLGTIATPQGGLPRAFIINVGDGYADMSLRKNRPTLIHELTHAWQGMRSALEWAVQVDSVVEQLKHGDHAYDYDPRHLKDWDQYHVEQQAKIVEDWYVEASVYHPHDDDIDGEDDPRYYFIVVNIRGKVFSPRIAPTPEEVTLAARYVAYETIPSVTDAYLVSILEKRFDAADANGAIGRVRKLDAILRTLSKPVASQLLTRLAVRRKGDDLVSNFYGVLSATSQMKLLSTLRARLQIP